MIFLGIDIGFDRCGFGILEFEMQTKKLSVISAGCITTNRQESIAKRLKCLTDDLNEIKHKYNPEFVSIEKLFFNRKNPTFEKVCMAKGVAMSVFASSELLEIEPKTMKKFITGSGNAGKAEIKAVLERILKIELKKIYDDTIDAIALGMYHAELKRFDLLKVNS